MADEVQTMARELERMPCPHGAFNQACCVDCLTAFYGYVKNPDFFGAQNPNWNSDKNTPIKRLTKQEFGLTWD